jgi:hypothetical protein
VSKPLPTYRERTNFDLSHVPAETGECIACGRALLRGERTACEPCKKLAHEALTNPVALAQLRAMAYAD